MLLTDDAPEAVHHAARDLACVCSAVCRTLLDAGHGAGDVAEDGADGRPQVTAARAGGAVAAAAAAAADGRAQPCTGLVEKVAQPAGHLVTGRAGQQAAEQLVQGGTQLLGVGQAAVGQPRNQALHAGGSRIG